MQEDREKLSQLVPKIAPAQGGGEHVGAELAAARDELEGVRKAKEALRSELDAARDELKGVREEKESLQSELKKIRALKVSELQKTRDVIIDPENVAGVLQPLLRHLDPAVRQEAARAAGSLGSPVLVFSLIQRLNDPDGGVRQAALRAVRAITNQRVVDELPEDEAARRDVVRGLHRCWTQGGSLIKTKSYNPKNLIAPPERKIVRPANACE